MTAERFNELLNGPLHHPMVTLYLTRLMLALREVVERCGEAGDRALEEHCKSREEQDRSNEVEAVDPELWEDG